MPDATPEQAAEQYVLYQYATCPYCQRVLRFLAEAEVDLPLKDTLRDPAARRELIQGGGDSQVPCLRNCCLAGEFAKVRRTDLSSGFTPQQNPFFDHRSIH
jgi:glutaredoxin